MLSYVFVPSKIVDRPKSEILTWKLVVVKSTFARKSLFYWRVIVSNSRLSGKCSRIFANFMSR